MADDIMLMDIDGPEFINEVNNQIASIRQEINTSVYQGTDVYIQEATPIETHLVAVLDTNFLISNLGFLKKLSDKANQFPGRLTLILPWVVIRELDTLKSRRNVTQTDEAGSDQVGNLARSAMRFLETTLQKRPTWLLGQKSYEKFSSSKKLSGDDAILDCCLYYLHHMNKNVMLLSNDRNLAIKAMVHHIHSLSAEKKSNLLAFIEGFGDLPESETYLKHHEEGDMDIDENTTTHVTSYALDEDMELDDVFSEKEKNHSTLSSIHAGSSPVIPNKNPLLEPPPRKSTPVKNTSWTSKPANQQITKDRSIWASAHAPR